MVTTDTEHFGLLGPLKASGAAIRVAEVRARPPEEALDAILARITPKTRLLALSHVSWQTGNLLPIEELREATDVPMLVDGAQSAGAIAVDAAPYDFYTVSGQKWLCGPDATGALYVRDPEALAVALPTYFSQEKHEANGEYAPRAGAARFDGGWLATSSLAGLEAALGTVPHWALHHSRDIAARCWALCPSASRSSPRPARRRSPRSSPGDPPPSRPRSTSRASSPGTCLAPAGCASRAAGGRTTAISTGCSTSSELEVRQRPGRYLKGETSAGPPSAVRRNCVADDR